MKLEADVVIAGGGLAGLGLARQIIVRRPETRIIVLEKQHFPRPRAVAKVGESTVEIGSRYLSHTLGLKEHLQRNHLLKFGLRIFFGAPEPDFSGQDELGPSQTFNVPTYQIDRGDLENHLHDELISLGVKIIDGADIRELELAPGNQRISVQAGDDVRELQAPWFIDAAGRAALLKKHLGLARPNAHKANAVWFRVKRRIEIDDWSADTSWRMRSMPEGERWLSTNHLSGAGYWVWIIPLANDVTSIGFVMDDTALADSGITDRDSAIVWLRQHHRRCAEAIEGAEFMDFVLLRDYSYDCRRLYSDEGWAITGEAGVFADPFYSPGSDFIAISNDFIQEIVCSSLDGEDIRFKAALFEKIFRSIYENTLSLYVDQYGGFGDRGMMGLKLVWDQSYYWGVLALLFFQGALTDIPLMRRANPILHRSQDLNKQVQAHFRKRAASRRVLPSRAVFLDQYSVPCLKFFNGRMRLPPLSEDELLHTLRESTDRLEELSAHIIRLLEQEEAGDRDDAETRLLGDYGDKVLA